MDEPIVELTRAWLLKADHDLRTAHIVGAAPDGPLDTAIYHCQQAAEKAVKAYLTSQDVPFEKIHDLGRLVAQAAARETRFDLWTAAAQLLTPYATAFRYPGIGEDPMPTRQEFEEAVRYAQAIYEFVIELVPGSRPKP